MKYNTYTFGAIVVLGLLVIPCITWAENYAEPGPFNYAKSDLPGDVSGATGGYLVVPDDSGPFPLLVTSHGWSSSSGNQIGWAEHFASWGFVVVVPDFPSPMSPDHEKNAGIVKDLLAYYRDPNSASPAQGKVDVDEFGLEGHSAGGLSTTLVSAEIQPGATVLFDPVDADGVGEAVYPDICGPVMGIFSEPGSCNSEGNWVPFKTACIGPTMVFNVVDSTHCDGELPPRGLCGPFCGGGAESGRQNEFKFYATAFFLRYLKDDLDAGQPLTEDEMTANSAIRDVIIEDDEDCTDDGGGDADADSDSDSDADSDGDGDGDGDADGDSDADGDGDGDSDSDGDTDSDSDADTDGDSDGDTDSDADSDADADTDADGDSDSDNGGDASGEGGCGCHVASPTPSLLSRLLSLLAH